MAADDDGGRPNLAELFAGAIRDLAYKQTAAFDQFLIYTHLASRDYRRGRWADATAATGASAIGAGDSSATQNTLLNINPEGNLLKEVKDIVDEIQIMMRVKEQQQTVMESLVKHIRRAVERQKTKPGNPPARAEPAVRRTIRRADQLLVDLNGRITELRTLLQMAQNTSTAVSPALPPQY